jgi:hypothetical protein
MENANHQNPSLFPSYLRRECIPLQEAKQQSRLLAVIFFFLFCFVSISNKQLKIIFVQLFLLVGLQQLIAAVDQDFPMLLSVLLLVDLACYQAA